MLATVRAYFFCSSLPSFSTTFSGSFCLTTHAFLWSVCIYVFEWAGQCFTASTAFTASDWSWMGIGKKREKKHLSPLHSINHDSSFSSTSLVPPSFTFYSHTSQPMSSHLPSPACKLCRSVSTNDTYQQWCVFSLHWHLKYKWGIIYNSPMDLNRKQKQLW